MKLSKTTKTYSSQPRPSVLLSWIMSVTIENLSKSEENFLRHEFAEVVILKGEIIGSYGGIET